MNYLINAFNGFCMALADSVPGVSGGTIAFILGFYDKFIKSLDGLFFGDKQTKKDSFFFLVKLGIGWVIGMILAILILTNLFESHIYMVSSLFLGFIVFSIPLIIKAEKDALKGKYINLIFTIIGIAVVALLTYFNPVSGNATSIDISSLNIGLICYIFIAVVLPGISGSTILLIFGLYVPILSAVKEVMKLNFNYLPVVIIFCLGVLTGVALVIKLIKIALEKFRSQTIYCIIGLMIGSLYSIVMGPTTLDVPLAPLGLSEFNIIAFIVGAVIIIGLDKLKEFLEKKNL